MWWFDALACFRDHDVGGAGLSKYVFDFQIKKDVKKENAARLVLR